MSWITFDNLKRFWKNVRTNPITFTGEVDLQNTTRYKGKEIATKADIAANDNKITIDSVLSSTSTNPVQNKVINAKINSVIDNPLVGNKVLWEHLHRFGNNPKLPTTNYEIDELGVFISYFDQNMKIANQPTRYGQLINIPANRTGDESTQLWIEQPSGRVYHRGGNASSVVDDTPFVRFIDTDDTKIVTVPITVVDPESIRNVKCLKSGHTVFVTFSVLKVKANEAPSKEKALITGLPHSVSAPLTVYAPTRTGSILRGDLTDDWFAWNYTPLWTVSNGDECMVTFTYFTND